MTTGTLAFALERFTDALLAELTPLLERHWREIAHYLDIPLAVDAAVYHAADAAGALRIVTVREDGALIGYAAYFVRPHAHYATSVQAVQDVVYVDPRHRGGLGARLLRAADDVLRAEGVQVVHQHVKLAHNWGALLERMGYEAVETIYSKRLDLQEPT